MRSLGSSALGARSWKDHDTAAGESGRIMSRNAYTRHVTLSMSAPLRWLVLVGVDCAIEHEVYLRVPDEAIVRRILRIPDDVPILIGRP